MKKLNNAVYLLVTPKSLLNLHVRKGGIQATKVSQNIDLPKLKIIFFIVYASNLIICFLFLDNAGSKLAINYTFITFTII